jgi:hypothetical protein
MLVACAITWPCFPRSQLFRVSGRTCPAMRHSHDPTKPKRMRSSLPRRPSTLRVMPESAQK